MTTAFRNTIAITELDNNLLRIINDLDSLYFSYPDIMNGLYSRARHWQSILLMLGMSKEEIVYLKNINIGNGEKSVVGIYLYILEGVITDKRVIQIYNDNVDIIRRAVIYCLFDSHSLSTQLEKFMGKPISTEKDKEYITEFSHEQWVNILNRRLSATI